ncbi:sulfite exporter TauE/SafE family protein [Salinibacillus aidingensis]|uniref:Probable membrane transporter protein n=2 Tax=Salinibacillus aidingensis TaxID=237684 RepID=A0ABN1BKJ5_9BACI
MVYIIMLALGFLSAFVGSIAGLGGGLIFVPGVLLLSEYFSFFSWASPQVVVGMSLLVMIITGFSSTYTYLKYKRVDLKSGGIFLAGSIPGALSGVWTNRFVEDSSFQLYFGILMIVLSLMFFLRKQGDPNPLIKNGSGINREFILNGVTYRYSFPVSLALIISYAVGFCSGLFGIGGGSLMVPAMILIFGFPAKIAAPTSMFMIFVSSSVSSIAHISLGHIIWEYIWFFIPGAWIGGTAGAIISQRLKGNTIEWILRILMIIVGIRLIWNGYTNL